MSESKTVTRRIYFTGRVQGVGFRWTTNRIATRFAVSGFVRNLADGRVELFSQGKSSEVDGFVDEVQRHFANNIESVELATIDDTTEYSEFTIRK